MAAPAVEAPGTPAPGTSVPRLAELLEATLAKGAEARFVVDGSSMWPLIRAGDVVCVRPPGEIGACVGDVVALRRQPTGNLVLHRLVCRRSATVLIRGDNLPQADGVCPAAHILGVVRRVERRGTGVWYGAGRTGPLTAFAVRSGLVCRLNRVARFLFRSVIRARPGQANP